MAFWGKLKFWGNKEPEFGKYPDMPQMPGEPGPFPDLNLQSFGMNPGQGAQGAQGMNANIGQDFRNYANQYPTFEPVQQQSIPRNVSFPGSSMQQPEFVGSKDMNMEVISAQLDALRASLDSIHERLANLERVAYGDYEQQKRGPSW